jgi:hypothetical protein
MKGIAIESIALYVLLFIVILVGIGLIKHFSKQAPTSPKQPTYNATYYCVLMNETAIDFEEFKDILYGFLTEQCINFYGKTRERITIEDIRRIVKSWDSSMSVISINECRFPSVNSHTVYTNFEEIQEGKEIEIKRKNMQKSDILICSR